ncbi:MAG TPA: M14 family metallopeptidase, partial [Symbiobacteriaceae bacterium]|nr:M14 family metallopeptidase [Symbiobacteriaceae bacterium]
YLNQLGLDLTGKGYAAPGGVEPWVVAGEGAPQARIRLYALPPAEAEVAPTLPARAADLPAPAAAIPTDAIIGPDDLAPYLAYLAELPGVRVWRTGRSFAGRATWALSVTAPTAGRIAPPQKLSAWRPTFLVNARHHANEVSSTNAVLHLAEYVARQGWANRVNLVVSPLENTDGAALHYAMQQVHPNWKLHAARFNAVGVEFYSEWFAPEPKYGEARPLPTLWRATLPDVVLDDHGYPSHEWVQPFSGYNSPPYFKTSWWMPNALIYSIHRWVDGAQFPANGAVQEGLRDVLAERLTADPQVAGYTATLLERYVTYGRQYVPEKFPLEQYRNFIAMTGNAPAGPESRTFVGRYPHITAAELVTEVPDETAQGDYLALCVHAHLQADLAILHYLAERPQAVVRRRWTEDGATCWTAGRERPFRV